MLISNKVLELNNKIRGEKLELEQNCDMAYRELDPIRRLRLKRINHLIGDLASTIGELSGWIYSPSGFILKSNYDYNPETQEITFDVNRVIKGINGYEPSEDRTAFELLFTTKYQTFLDRLFKLEKKRDTLINPIINEHCISISYSKDKGNEQVKESTPKENTYLQIASDRFLSIFGVEGVNRLVNLLNYLVNTNDNEPVDMYNRQFFNGATSLYIDELFRWASSFTPRADYVERGVAIKREAMNRELNPEGFSK